MCDYICVCVHVHTCVFMSPHVFFTFLAFKCCLTCNYVLILIYLCGLHVYLTCAGMWAMYVSLVRCDHSQSNHWSYAALSPVRTWMGDHLSYTGSCQDVIPAVLCYGLCHMSIQEFTECYPTHKKGWVVCCHVYVAGAHKRTCVVHWNMPNHHTSIYQRVEEQKCCAEGSNDKRGTALHKTQTCMLPRELIWEGVAPPQETEWYSMKKWPWAAQPCKAHGILPSCVLWPLHYIKCLMYVCMYICFSYNTPFWYKF